MSRWWRNYDYSQQHHYGPWLLIDIGIEALLFKHPDGRWQDGAYELALNTEKARAALPITLR